MSDCPLPVHFFSSHDIHKYVHHGQGCCNISLQHLMVLYAYYNLHTLHVTYPSQYHTVTEILSSRDPHEDDNSNMAVYILLLTYILIIVYLFDLSKTGFHQKAEPVRGCFP